MRLFFFFFPFHDPSLLFSPLLPEPAYCRPLFYGGSFGVVPSHKCSKYASVQTNLAVFGIDLLQLKTTTAVLSLSLFGIPCGLIDDRASPHNRAF